MPGSRRCRSAFGWAKDFADPYGFDYFPFDSEGIGCKTAVNYYLVGVTPAIAKECGISSQYNAYVAKNGPMLSVDKAISTTCEGQTGSARDQCFISKVDAPVEKSAVVAPWSWDNNVVITGTTVTNYQYDANADTISTMLGEREQRARTGERRLIT